MKKQIKINMDNFQRISLTRLLSKEERKLFSSFKAYKDEDGRIVLEPLIEVPAREHWIYKNPTALASLIQGIEDAKAGRIKDRGSFAKYAKEDGDEDR
ncbi:MAG: hypothetical protein CK425_08260 [Parachlamydia sp.]|nr:MAG: hypothetical protein CK425_08260 [Parachlamydia sp.]